MNASITAAWREYKTQPVQSAVVDPSMPILFFGDSRKYEASDVRVITVGLNPSLAEFPSAEPFQRFRSCSAIAFSTVVASRT